MTQIGGGTPKIIDSHTALIIIIITIITIIIIIINVIIIIIIITINIVIIIIIINPSPISTTQRLAVERRRPGQLRFRCPVKSTLQVLRAN